MNTPSFTAEASLYKTSGHFCTTYTASSTGDVIQALILNPSPAPLPGRWSLFDTCGLGCYLKCRYIDKNDDLICSLYCRCLG